MSISLRKSPSLCRLAMAALLTASLPAFAASPCPEPYPPNARYSPVAPGGFQCLRGRGPSLGSQPAVLRRFEQTCASAGAGLEFGMERFGGDEVYTCDVPKKRRNRAVTTEPQIVGTYRPSAAEMEKLKCPGDWALEYKPNPAGAYKCWGGGEIPADAACPPGLAMNRGIGMFHCRLPKTP
ncbi:MAG: hypothetical protein HZC37_21230 [Burkholderiales bacterium]|nr:hypothetical protein [Burkholderiales bacterium]